MQVYFAIVLTIAAVVLWVIALRVRNTAPLEQRLAYTVSPVVAAWLVALLTPTPDDLFYKGAVVLGLLMAFIALLLHASDFLPTYAAHAHLFLTYILYAYAFASQTHGWPSPWALLLVAGAGLIYYWFFPTLYELSISAAIYGLLILLATWQALEIVLQQPDSWMGWAALTGMLLMIAATLLEAQARFHRFRPTWAVAALPAFILAQLAIAWSVWG